MNKLFLDFETFWDRKQGYDLGSLSIPEYVRDERFLVQGVSFGYEGEEIHWADADTAKHVLSSVDWSDTVLVAHNTKFDAFILTEHYGFTPASYICTKAMSKAVVGKRVKSHSLSVLSPHFGLTPKDKSALDSVEGKRELIQEESDRLGVYCSDDTRICMELYARLKPEFPESQYRPMSWTIKAFVEPKLLLDVPLLQQAAIAEKERRQNIFTEIGIEKKEFSSNPKFAALLRKEGFEVPMKTSAATGKQIPAFALGDVDFVAMVNSENQRLRDLCEARIAAKANLMQTRSESLAAVGETGPWSFDVEFSGAEQTHRYSGGGAAGGNPQNFTRGSVLRKAVIAPRGFLLAVGDFSKVEPRLVAALSKDMTLLEDLKSDPYCRFASGFYNRPIDKKVDKDAYNYGKEGVLSLGYRMGWEKFQIRVKIKLGLTVTEKEARQAVEFYRYRYRGVKEYWELLDRNIYKLIDGTEGQFLETPFRYAKEKLILPSGLCLQYPNLRQEMNERGRPEWIYDIYKHGKKTRTWTHGGKLLGNMCQSLAGELTKEAINRVEDYAYGQLHDEILMVVPRDRAESMAEALECVMSESPSWLPTMKLGAEVGFASNWLDAKV